jgi:hypothetical protein
VRKHKRMFTAIKKRFIFNKTQLGSNPSTYSW